MLTHLIHKAIEAVAWAVVMAVFWGMIYLLLVFGA